MKKMYPLVLLVISSLFSFSQTQSFTSSGSYLVPTGVTSVTIEVVGAGGTGGGNGGGGGGGGGYAKGTFAVTPGSSLPVTIGIGGSGTVGGTSSVSNLISATGGANGTSVPNPAVGGGGAGGSGTNGNIVNRTGGNGGGAYWTYFGGGGGGAGGPAANGSNGGNTIAWTGICQTPGGSAGISGGAPGGNGGKGAGFTDVNCNVTDPSAPGSIYGGGGGGANGNGGGASVGANGYCFISWGSGTCTAPAAPSNVTPLVNLSGCGPLTATLLAISSGTVIWYTGATGTGIVGTGTTFVTPSLNNTSSVPTYSTYYAEAYTCTNSAVRTPVTVTINPPPTLFIVSTSTAVCPGMQAMLAAAGGVTYTWAPYNSTQMTFSTGVNTGVNPTITTVYTVTGVASTGCTNTASISITVLPPAVITVLASTNTICAGSTATLTASGTGTIGWVNYNPSTMTISASAQMIVKPTYNITYSVVGSDLNGCLGITSISIFVTPLPTLTVSSTKNIICSGETVSITASGATSYVWITNATSSVISVAPVITTGYAVSGTTDGCSKLASFTQSVTICTAINSELQYENKLFVYPNPNNGSFMITARIDLNFDLIDFSGRNIRSISLTHSNNHTVNIEGIPPGIYFVKSKNIDLLISGKIISVIN